MQQLRYMLAVFSASASFVGSGAFAEDSITTEQLRTLITGNTLYVDMAAGAPGAPDGGTAPIYYSEDGEAAALLPSGVKLMGKWALQDDRYCIDWDNGPKNSCTQLIRTSEGFVVLDANRGEPRGVVTRLATGNPENL